LNLWGYDSSLISGLPLVGLGSLTLQRSIKDDKDRNQRALLDQKLLGQIFGEVYIMVYDFFCFFWFSLLVLPLGVFATGCGEKIHDPHEVASPGNKPSSKVDIPSAQENQRSATEERPAVSHAAGAPPPAFSQHEVFTGVIKEVPAGDWTFGNPPKVIVEVEEVLFGKSQKGKLTVVWGPPTNDFDTTDREPEIKLWKTRKLEIPKVGEKWIIGANPFRDEWYSSAGSRVMWSKENKARIIVDREAAERFLKDELRRQNRTPEEISKARSKWRDSIKEEDIKNWTAKADFIAVGKTLGLSGSGEKWQCTFGVEEVLKGQYRWKYSHDQEQVRVYVKGNIAELLMPWNDRCLLFLSERGMGIGSIPPPFYMPVGDVVAVPDEAAMKIVRQALKDNATKPPIVVALCGFLPYEMITAVGGQISDAVVIGVMENVQETRKQVLGMDYVVNIMVDSTGKVEHVQGFRANTEEMLQEDHWSLGTEKEMVDKVVEFIEKLLKK
jgi:hypothetical protein